MRTFQQAMDLLLQRVQATRSEVGLGFPVYSDSIAGRWTLDNGWTAPFWIGMQWLAYAYTGRAEFRDYGIRLLHALDPYPARFQYFIAGTLGHWFTAADLPARQAVRGAEYLQRMFTPTMGQIPAFPGENDVIVDVLPSLAVLWWHWQICGDENSRDAALAHWRRSAVDFVRADGATYQSIHYDLETGQLLMRHCHHDARWDDACASQTHAWAVSGFAYAYQAQQEEEFLLAGRRVTDFALQWLPKDGVPFHNFGQHEPYRDTSAAAIIASALLDWAELDPDAARRRLYRAKAKQMLTTLIAEYLTPLGAEDTRPRGMLLEGCYNYLGQVPKNELIWGTYFFMEALFKWITQQGCLLHLVLSDDILA